MTSLPTGWQLVPLESLVKEALSGFASGKRDANGTIQVRMNNVTTGGNWDWSKVLRVPASEKQYTKYRLEAGDVLVNTTNSPNLVGKTVYFFDSHETLVFSNHFVRLRLKHDKIDPDYLRRWLNVLWNRRVFQGLCTQWVNQASVRKEDLLALHIPLPPLEDQRRIATILNKADAVRRKRQEAIALTEELLRSAFLEMFGDPITNSKGWHTKQLGDLAQFVGGGTPSRQKSEYYQGGVCWATPKDMRVDVLTDTEEHITPEAIKQSATKLVGIGSLLVVVKSKVLARRLPIARTIVPTCFGQDLKAVIPYEAAITRYLHRHIKYGEQTLLQLARGINTEGLTLEHLRNYQVMIPPASEVARFVQLDSVLENAKNKQKAFLDKSTNLFNSLLQRAFRGEL